MQFYIIKHVHNRKYNYPIYFQGTSVSCLILMRDVKRKKEKEEEGARG